MDHREKFGATEWVDQIWDHCNDYFSFPPHGRVSYMNHYNYMNQKLEKWIGAYDNAKCMQQSRLSVQDIGKAHEICSGGGTRNFNLMKEWIIVRDQPHYVIQITCNSGSGSSGSKRAHESEANDSNSVRSNGEGCIKKKTKKKGKGTTLKVVNEIF